MYEGFFGLSNRPFSAVPNPESYVALEPIQDALDDLLICVAQGRGIAVLTAAAGLGKTLVCKQLTEIAAARFQSLYLSTSTFSTRRALLQGILYEFGIEYEGLSEQEARLKILEAARAIACEGRLLLIIVDEAHLLNGRLFEELRTLADYAPEGEALIRLVFSGQYELDEKLADPAMSALHQRIGCQVSLHPLSLSDSAALIKERLKWSGASQLNSLLTDSALEAICRASDGNPRCLCQLADHSLLLAFSEDQKPLQRETVVAALEDLKELPLHWNDLPRENFSIDEFCVNPENSSERNWNERQQSGRGRESSPNQGLTSHKLVCDISIENGGSGNPDDSEFVKDEFEMPQHLGQSQNEKLMIRIPDQSQPEKSAPVEYSVFEVGAELPVAHPQEWIVPQRSEPKTAQSQQLNSTPQAGSEISHIEEPVIDKYAALDRLRELPPGRAPAPLPGSVNGVPEKVAYDWENLSLAVTDLVVHPEDSARPLHDEEEIFETIENLRREIGYAVDDSRAKIEVRRMDHDFGDWPTHDVVEPEFDELSETQKCTVEKTLEEVVHATPESIAAETRMIEPDSGSDSPEIAEESSHRFAQLFTRLRQRRRTLKEQKVEGSSFL